MIDGLETDFDFRCSGSRHDFQCDLYSVIADARGLPINGFFQAADYPKNCRVNRPESRHAKNRQNSIHARPSSVLATL